MGNKHDEHPHSITNRHEGRLIPARAAQTAFTPRADLTYRLIEGISLTDADAAQSLLSGAILRDCQFRNVNFRRCDLDGCRMERCSFVGCDFLNDEFRAVNIAGSSFEGCSLAGAFFSDATVIDTAFRDSSFELLNATSTSFLECAFTRCALRGSSITHTRYERCSFEGMLLGDCTFLYNILAACKFADCGITIESLGMLYGLDQDALAAMNLVYLGAALPPEFPRDPRSLRAFYLERKWYFGASIIAISARLASTLYCVRSCLATIADRYAAGHALSIDEIRFLSQLLIELDRSSRLPVQSCLDVLSTTRAILDARPTAPNLGVGRDLTALRELSSTAHMHMLGMFDRLEEAIPPDAFMSAVPMAIHAEFEVQPRVELTQVLREIANALGAAADLEVRYERSGSFETLLIAPAKIAAAFLLLLYLVNGLVIQITILKGRIQQLTHRQLPKQYQDIVRTTANPVPDLLRKPLTRIFELIPHMPWTESEDLGGLSEHNIRSIRVSEPEGTKKE